MKIAILDDYQNVALRIADWSAVAKKADITVFNDQGLRCLLPGPCRRDQVTDAGGLALVGL